jgi:Family of unknown function (DUF5946)
MSIRAFSSHGFWAGFGNNVGMASASPAFKRARVHGMSEDRCPDCGAPVEGGRAGCQALWDEIALRAYSEPGYAATHDLAFDTYCMQHPERYCRSAKSYAAHLTRLCCGLEHEGKHKVYQAIQQSLSGAVQIERPVAPTNVGKITVADLKAARSVEEHAETVHAWANSVWQAYAEQHELARGWMNTALSL